MRNDEVDALWSQYIGSRRLTLGAEISQLRKLAGKKLLSWEILMCLFYSSKIWNALRWKVLQRDKVCVLCGSGLHLHVDHIKYPEKIGGERLTDLRLLCFSCHKKKTLLYDLGANGFDDSLKVEVEEDVPLYAAKGVRDWG